VAQRPVLPLHRLRNALRFRHPLFPLRDKRRQQSPPSAVWTRHWQFWQRSRALPRWEWLFSSRLFSTHILEADQFRIMAAANIVTLNSGNFSEQVLKSTTPVLVDFWAEWCGPCKMIAPVLDELAGEYDGRIRIGKVNIDEDQALASQFGIRAIPTLLIFKNGQVAEQIVGMKSKRDLKASLDKAAA
jgi:thioredoxin 1